jgi:hypothetical protein
MFSDVTSTANIAFGFACMPIINVFDLTSRQTRHEAVLAGAIERFAKMSSTELYAKRLERPASMGESKFTFIGNGFEMECIPFEAALISPPVHLPLQQGPTVNSFF